MKSLSPGLAAHLATRCTTLARCWKIERADEEVFGFTEHDRDLAFDTVTYRAASALTRSQIQQSLGLEVDNVDVGGALNSNDIDEDAIARGLFDFAEVTVYLVNWADVSQRHVEFRGNIGEVRRGKAAFNAELRSISDRLNQRSGRVYATLCDADLGDTRCGIDLDDPDFKGTGTVGSSPEAHFIALSGVTGFETAWFNGGLLRLTSGVNAGMAREVKAHTIAGGVHYAELWQGFPSAPAPGDTLTITAGCDKRFETCKAKFANTDNFRGFPHMPGNDRVTAHPRSGEVMDGGSLFSS